MRQLAIDPEATMEYRLDSDEEGPVFILGSIDVFLRATIADGNAAYYLKGKDSDGEAGVRISGNRRNVELVKFGLKGWKNLKTAGGLEIVFETWVYDVPGLGKRTGVSENKMSHLRFEWIDELAREILRQNALTGEEQKN